MWLDDRDVVLHISHFGSSGHVGEPQSFRGKARCSLTIQPPMTSLGLRLT